MAVQLIELAQDPGDGQVTRLSHRSMTNESGLGAVGSCPAGDCCQDRNHTLIQEIYRMDFMKNFKCVCCLQR